MLKDLPFSLIEYGDRIRKTKEQMIEQGVEVLLLADPANMYYLSGYDGWSFYVPQLLVIILDEEQPIWIGRKQDVNGAKLTVWFHPDRILSYPECYIHADERHPMDYIAYILKMIGQGSRRIGVEMDAYYFTARSFASLQKNLPNATFIDAGLLVNRLRMIKSSQEIEYMKQAGRIAERAMLTAMETIAAGVRECDAAAAISHAQISGLADCGGDYPAIVPLLPAGEKSCTPHLTWTERRYCSEEAVIVELAGCYRRYHTPFARTAVIGPPSPPIRELGEVVAEGLNAALNVVAPGVTCAEVAEAWQRTIQRRGYEKESRLGYSVGLSYPPDWGEHTASIRAEDHTILQPNMTFHLIPGMWLEEYGVELSETFRVTEAGCELFSHFSRELIQRPAIPNIVSPFEDGA
ncbi:Xaa-Pro dipeptidase [Marininema mesophilum]|uniref:Xaa-Pro dipeptidase n=1 Tax=Marininema mesophilum TaxID=1048340 RepID=A0A1H2V8Y4_9BACL|nr:M24 family metallopeptidase [Marininema mesophilum]SDW64773.1 Xaa-Pro dipeptidase [Marininema mesophilum]